MGREVVKKEEYKIIRVDHAVLGDVIFSKNESVKRFQVGKLELI